MSHSTSLSEPGHWCQRKSRPGDTWLGAETWSSVQETRPCKSWALPQLQPQVEITVNKLVFSKNVFRRCGHFYKPHTPGQIPPPLVGEPHVEGTLFPQAVFLWALPKKSTDTILLFWWIHFWSCVVNRDAKHLQDNGAALLWGRLSFAGNHRDRHCRSAWCQSRRKQPLSSSTGIYIQGSLCHAWNTSVGEKIP